MPQNWEREPIQALQDLLGEERTRKVLSIASRQSPDSPHFDPKRLRAITDPGLATIYYVNLSTAVNAYERNGQIFRARHEAARDRTSLLVASVITPLSEYVERPLPKEASELYMVAKSPEEILAWTSKEHQQQEDRDIEFNTHLGIPEGKKLHIEGISWMDRFQVVEKELQDGMWQFNTRLGLSDGFLVFASDMLHSGLFNSGILGVGEYQLPVAQKLVRAYHKVVSGIAAHEDAFAAFEEQIGPEEVAKFVRARDKSVSNENQLTTQLTLTEGALTILQVLNMMVAMQQPGYENNPDQLVLDLIDRGIIVRFARKIPFSGIIGPMSNRGIVIMDLLQEGGDGLALNRQLEVVMAELRRNERDAKILREEPQYPTQKGEEFMSYGGCPAAFSEKKGEPNSVEIMADVFKRAYLTV